MMRIETERLYIRRLTGEDYVLMSSVWAEKWPPSMSRDSAFMDKLFQRLWEGTQEPSLLTGLIFLRDGDMFCGRVNMQNIDQETPEIGIDLLSAYQNQGYGPEAITGFANWYQESCHASAVKVRIAEANTRSRHVFEKLGAELLGETSMLSDIMRETRKNASEDSPNTAKDIIVREYILKLPACRTKFTKEGC